MKAVPTLPMLATLFVLGATMTTAPASAGGGIDDIVVTVTTDRSAYPTGIPVEITVTECNPTAAPVTVIFDCPCCHDTVEVLDPQGDPLVNCSPGCVQSVTPMTWEPGECKSHSVDWQQTAESCDAGTQVADGLYRVENRRQFPGFEETSLSAPFLIGAATPVIPAASPWGLAALALLLSIVGLWALRAVRLRE